MSRRDLWDQVDGDLYQVLGVEKSATADEIQSAWRTTAKRLHPDLGGSVTDFQQAEIAYQVLSDPLERGRYDRQQRVSQPFSTSSARTRQYAYSYSGNNWAKRDTGEAPFFDPTSPNPYVQEQGQTARTKRNPWLIALAVVVGIVALVAAVMLALVTFLVLFVAVILLVGRGLNGRSKPDQQAPKSGY